jgi:hypothetical protein
MTRGELVAHRLVRRARVRWITQGYGRLDPGRSLCDAPISSAQQAWWPAVSGTFRALLLAFEKQLAQEPRTAHRLTHKVIVEINQS